MSSTRKEEEKKQDSKYRPKTKHGLSKKKVKKILTKIKNKIIFPGLTLS